MIRDVASRTAPAPMFQVAIIAIDKHGAPGASCSFDSWTDEVTKHEYPGLSRDDVVLALMRVQGSRMHCGWTDNCS